jgi:hypothetical protein
MISGSAGQIASQSRESRDKEAISKVGMAMGEDEQVNRRQLFGMYRPFRAGGHRTLLEWIEENRVHQADGVGHLDENRSVPE